MKRKGAIERGKRGEVFASLLHRHTQLFMEVDGITSSEKTCLPRSSWLASPAPNPRAGGQRAGLQGNGAGAV